MRQIGIIGFAAIACGIAMAQSDSGNMLYTAKIRAEGKLGNVVTARFGMMGPAVKGAPYSAEGVTEVTQTLGDGTHINRQESYMIYRDGEGRVRRESGDQVWISDPVAGASYVLDTKQQTARQMALSRNVAFAKIQSDGQQTAKLKAEAHATQAFSYSGGMKIMPDTKSESLGKQEMEGVEVEGTRTTSEIPLGQIGNDRPLQTVSERWESTELHVTVLSKHSDPMAGNSTERLANIRRGEPDPALFQVPAGYAIEAEK